MHDVAEVVADHLELDVPGRLDVLLEVHVADAERSLSLALRGLVRVRQFTCRPDDAHAASAATGRSFDDDGIADLLRGLQSLLFAFDETFTARKNGDPRLLHHATRTGLVAHQTDHLRIRTDELDVAGLADFGQVRAL